MKKSIVYLSVVIVTSTFLLSFIKTSFQQKDTGAVGDVKYSILNPLQFRAQNGDGWILLDGGANIEAAELYASSTLKNVLQLPSLPDARGVFLRGMNENRDALTGDPGGNRNVGDRQADAIKKHNHNMRHWWGHGDNGGTELSTNSGLEISAAQDVENGLAEETRPRNIALYIYVKIN